MKDNFILSQRKMKKYMEKVNEKMEFFTRYAKNSEQDR